jgi:hypothetical protein
MACESDVGHRHCHISDYPPRVPYSYTDASTNRENDTGKCSSLIKYAKYNVINYKDHQLYRKVTHT